MDLTGTVFDIKRYALHDGPGIRTTVFLKGCPLRCPWCHNPEGVSPAPEFMWWEVRCLGCRACEQACPRGAISFPGAAPAVDHTACDMCGACARACYPHALEIAGCKMTVGEVLAEVEKDAVFYGRSGGGVTFSGGEPLMQPEFLKELLKECKRLGIHRAVDTSGHADREVMLSVMNDVDLFLYDIKVMDEGAHEGLTGVSNSVILDNLRMLVEHGKRVAVRFAVIPGVNDSAENVDALGAFVASLGDGCEVHPLPYHRAGAEKSGRLVGSRGTGTFDAPSADMIRSVGDRLKQCGLRVRAGG
jgi:pyruvate formate lyase activating enzyme